MGLVGNGQQIGPLCSSSKGLLCIGAKCEAILIFFVLFHTFADAFLLYEAFLPHSPPTSFHARALIIEKKIQIAQNKDSPRKKKLYPSFLAFADSFWLSAGFSSVLPQGKARNLTTLRFFRNVRFQVPKRNPNLSSFTFADACLLRKAFAAELSSGVFV